MRGARPKRMTEREDDAIVVRSRKNFVCLDLYPKLEVGIADTWQYRLSQSSQANQLELIFARSQCHCLG